MEALTYGELPGIKKAFILRKLGQGGHAKKVQLLSELARTHRRDPYLKRASFRSGVVAWTHKLRQIDLPMLGKQLKTHFGQI